jgi:hypothetical protein
VLKVFCLLMVSCYPPLKDGTLFPMAEPRFSLLKHPQLKRIESDLLERKLSLRGICEKYSVTYSAVQRYRDQYFYPLIQASGKARERGRRSEVRERIDKAANSLQMGLESAIDNQVLVGGKPLLKDAAAIATPLTNILRLLAEVSGEGQIHEGAQQANGGQPPTLNLYIGLPRVDPRLMQQAPAPQLIESSGEPAPNTSHTGIASPESS